MKIPRSRIILYSMLLLPLLAAVVFLCMMPAGFRGEFLADYGRTIGRIVKGEWSFSELNEPERQRGREQWRGNGRGRPSAAGAFERLDKNENGRLDSSELGNRLLASLGKSRDEELSVSLDEFQTAMYSHRLTRDEQALPVKVKPAIGTHNEPASVIKADALFDPTRVVQIEISIPEDDWQALCAQRRSHQSAFEDPSAKPYSYFKGDITIDGTVIKDVAIRKKGFLGSQDNVRPAMKVKINKYVDQHPIEGLDRLTLNNNKQDRALVSQYLTYQLFNKAGIPAPRCSFAAVTVNGNYLGVYSNVEPVKKTLLQREFGDGKGNLYEGTLTDFYPKSIQWFEADTNKKNNDRSQLLALSNLLDSGQPSVKDISQFVDIDGFLRYWAIESLINFWDGYTQNQNNFFVYQNPTDGLMHFMPWGADSCFTDRRPFRGGGNADSVRAVGILANRLYHQTEIQERYRSVMLDVLSDDWEEQHLRDELDRITELLFHHIDFHQIQALEAMDDVREFIDQRRETIMRELSDDLWPAPVPSQPRTPLYEDEIGTITGEVQCSADVTSEASKDELKTGIEAKANVELVMEDQTAVFRSAQVYGLDELAAGENSSLVIDLETTHEDQDIELAITTEPQKGLESGKYPISGMLLDWSDVQQGREIRGELNITTADVTAGKLEATFELKLHEKRGGHFEGRRW